MQVYGTATTVPGIILRTFRFTLFKVKNICSSCPFQHVFVAISGDLLLHCSLHLNGIALLDTTMGDISRDIMPEKACSSGKKYYNNIEASRYSHCPQTQGIQRDLTRECVRLMADFLDFSERPFLLNVGSGSGLCGSVLSDINTEWIGIDISRAMLEKSDPLVENIEMDCFQHLPFRNEVFDGAISVSAVQWVCVASFPEIQSEIFMKEMFRIMKRGTVFVAQWYPSCQLHVSMLQNAANAAGFWGDVYTSFPHDSKARKKIMCLYKPSASLEQKPLMEACTCCLSWPFEIPCVVSWMLLTRSIQFNHALNVKKSHIESRMSYEHMENSCRMIRLLRRAAGSCGQPAPTMTTNEIFSYSNVDLSPCGGVISCHVWTEAGVEYAQGVVVALFNNISLGMTYEIHHTKSCHQNGTLDSSWRHFTENSSNKYFQLKKIVHGKDYTVAMLTAPKLPSLTAVMFKLGHENKKLHNFIHDNRFTVIGIDIRLLKNDYSAAVLLYMPRFDQHLDAANALI